MSVESEIEEMIDDRTIDYEDRISRSEDTIQDLRDELDEMKGLWKEIRENVKEHAKKYVEETVNKEIKETISKNYDVTLILRGKECSE